MLNHFLMYVISCVLPPLCYCKWQRLQNGVQLCLIQGYPKTYNPTMNKFATGNNIDYKANCNHPLPFNPIGPHYQFRPLKCFGSGTTP